ncbi:MAG: winged helix-turn-helix transcriptional regulator [Candidatus Doudnabacteria bacterium]|nr:winged helix-turn-helix transcriptional regulator [Candidatus Doudnabacteria bacterium]
MLTKLKEFKLSPRLSRKARLLELAGDPTRIRILCLMFQYRKACVSDIAQSLGMSLASVSHHLQMMRDNGLLTSERLGNNICYILAENEFARQLKRIICDVKV